ncbi:MAG: hydrolase [Deltaproteobacteria bacterium]|nr:hydrolase [Deltaproteobacteria bacterium]
MRNRLPFWPIAFVVAALAAGCSWSAPRALIKVGTADSGIWVSGLSSCRPEDGKAITIDPTRPLTLFVHGCNFSTGGFRTLARVFEAHGQQTLCFNYDDRERLDVASTKLIAALEALEKRLPRGEITLVGHSQGGLVSRHAVVRDRERPMNISSDFRIRLVTVSSPFAGIDSSRHCGLTWLHLATIGVTALVCQGIAGSKWHDIYPGSRFMRRPGTLASAVTSHVKIVTDERGTCRRTGYDGNCAEGDFIFALDEQYSSDVDKDHRVAAIEVKAGHIEIVGERGTPPTKLLSILQAQQILVQTPPERRTQIAALLEQLY